MSDPVTTRPRLLSVNVGMPRDVEWQGGIVHTGIWKEPVDGPRMVRRLNIDGDGQGDLAGHGGVNRAVFVYQIESYRYWQEQLRPRRLHVRAVRRELHGRGAAPTTRSASATATGSARRCSRSASRGSRATGVGLRMDEPRMPSLLVAHHRPGFYLRVLEEGGVGAGDEIEKLDTGAEAMTVAEIDGLLYLPPASRTALARALRIPALSEGWQGSFRELLEQPAAGDGRLAPHRRSPGPGLRTLRVESIDRESRERRSRSACARGRRRRSGAEAGPVPDRARAARPGGGAAAAHVLAVRTAERERLPHQRQARAARRGERVPAHRPARRRRTRGRSAAGHVRARAGRAAGRAGQRRRRGDPGAGDAARARLRVRAAAGVVAARGPRRQPSTRSGRGRRAAGDAARPASGDLLRARCPRTGWATTTTSPGN